MTGDGRTETRSGFAAELGVVFCGGESRRMGRDKAVLEIEGRTMLERAIACLERIAPAVVLACGPEDRYQGLGMERVLDPRPGLGPIGGLAASLRRLQREGTDPGRSILYALACDMPLARPEIFRALSERLAVSGADAVLVRTDEGIEPLLAVYRGSALPAVERAVARGERRMVSFHGEIEVALLDPVTVAGTAPERYAQCATNVNTPEELRALQGRLA